MIDHNTLVAIINQRLQELNLSAREASIRAVNNPELIRSIRKNHSPSLNNLRKLLNVLDIELHIEGEQRYENKIPILGLVGAGSRIAYFNDQFSDYDTISFPSGKKAQLIAAAEVRGNSMEPVYHQGEILFFNPEDPSRFDITQHIGRDCIVTLCEDSSALLKTIECGSRPGLWNLHSHNPQEEVITDQELQMALPILWVKRSR